MLLRVLWIVAGSWNITRALYGTLSDRETLEHRALEELGYGTLQRCLVVPLWEPIEQDGHEEPFQEPTIMRITFEEPFCLSACEG